MTTRDLWAELPARLTEAPPRVRTRVCEAVWFAVLCTEDTDTMIRWARELYRIDRVARAVPGDTRHRVWSHTGRRPCATCLRDPHAPECTDAPPEGAN